MTADGIDRVRPAPPAVAARPANNSFATYFDLSVAPPARNPLRTLARWYRPEARTMGLALLLYMIKQSPVWVMPLLAADIVAIITPPIHLSLGRLIVDTVLTVVLVLQNIPMHYLYIRVFSRASRNVETRLRAAAAWRLQHLSLGFFAQHDTATLQTKVLRDVEQIQILSQQAFDNVPTAIIALLVAVVVTVIRVPGFLIFDLLAVALGFGIYRLSRRDLATRNRDFRADMELVSAQVGEMLRLVPLTRAHAVEETELARLEAQLQRLRSAGRRLDGTTAVINAATWSTFRLGDTLCLGLAAFLAYTHLAPLTVSDVVLLTGFFRNISDAVLQLNAMVTQLAKGLEAVRSLSEILAESDIEQNEGKTPVEAIAGRFQFQHVGFRYPQALAPAVTDFTLDVAAGETIALVGRSGSGKSTVINLVLGFLRPTTGHILLDGQPMQEIDLRTYRRQVAVVAQETVLFRGTLRENILYGSTNVSEAVFRKALKDAAVDEFLDQLPDGVETLLGENGARLSGGQKQRIAIARAFVRQPRVLILDEATSALDAPSELLIQQALERLRHGRTTFIVAHRMATIQEADQIIVLDHGRIVEAGTHAELVQRPGLYADLASVIVQA